MPCFIVFFPITLDIFVSFQKYILAFLVINIVFEIV